MCSKFLQRGNDKTELLLKGNSKRVAYVQDFEIFIGDSVFMHFASARNIDVFSMTLD